MDVILALLAGLGTGMMVTLIPGMLNMQVVSSSLNLGTSGAYRFSLGLVTVIGIQASLAVFFAEYLVSAHVIGKIQRWAVPLLTVLSLGFAVKGYTVRRARQKKVVVTYQGNPYLRGLMMGSMNVLNIPILFTIATFLIAGQWLMDEDVPRLLFILGVGTGAGTVFFSYARSADWISRHAEFFTRNIYFFLSGLLAFLAIVRLIQF